MPDQLPVPVSRIFCDDVFHDPKTEKAHVIGAFDTLRVRTLPLASRTFSVLILLTRGTGTYTGQVICFRPGGRRAFGSPPRTLWFPSARKVVWAAFRLSGVRLSEAGVYRMQFFCDNQMLSERPLNVLVIGGNGDV